MCVVDSIVSTLKKSFSFAGRASRAEFWLFTVAYYVLAIILCLLEGLFAGSAFGTIWGILSLIVLVALLVPFVSVSVRRLHDLGLSGFWLWYLNPFGLPVIYVVYLLDLDQACNKLIEKISKVGSAWLGWILTIMFYPIGATVSLFLLFLYKGKPEDNEFGPCPQCKCSKKPELNA